jgi:hypothetical protein
MDLSAQSMPLLTRSPAMQPVQLTERAEKEVVLLVTSSCKHLVADVMLVENGL